MQSQIHDDFDGTEHIFESVLPKTLQLHEELKTMKRFHRVINERGDTITFYVSEKVMHAHFKNNRDELIQSKIYSLNDRDLWDHLIDACVVTFWCLNWSKIRQFLPKCLKDFLWPKKGCTNPRGLLP